MMKLLKGLGLALVLGATAAPVAAQNTDNGGSFLNALRDGDNNKAVELLEARGSTVINFKGARGDAPLHIVTRKRDLVWLGYLIGRGADVNVQNDSGETPLIGAGRIGWLEGVDRLLQLGARPDLANRLGETALIIAVQQRQLPVVRRLIEYGASPDRRDNASGRSAREYAKLVDRSGDVTRVIDTALPRKPLKGAAGPKL